MDTPLPYTEAQLSKYRSLIRLASRWLFSGDLSERITQTYMDEAKPDAPRKRKRSKVSESDLAVVIMDALSYHDGWVSEEKFCQKILLGGKQVRRMMQYLERQGFVVREHRRERKQGNKVESVAEQDQLVAQPRTATYVTIDYPHLIDMLRLRLYLVKKQAKDRIDSGDTVEQYACCSRDGMEPVCGRKYTSFDMLDLEPGPDGFYVCATCDNGIVAPDDPLSQSEVSGELRIKRARHRRETASTQRMVLMTALKPLDSLLQSLEKVDPPDFGSFTDWSQRRQELIASGQATAVGSGKRGGRSGGHLDYGIDGPLVGDAGIAVEIGGDTSAAPQGRVIDTSSEAPDPKASLPYFMQHGPQGREGEVVKDASIEADTAEEDERARRYKEFMAQYHATMAQHMAEAKVGPVAASGIGVVKKEEMPQEEGAANEEFDFEPAFPSEQAKNGAKAGQAAEDDGGDGDDGLEWEDA